MWAGREILGKGLHQVVGMRQQRTLRAPRVGFGGTSEARGAAFFIACFGGGDEFKDHDSILIYDPPLRPTADELEAFWPRFLID